MMCSKLHCQKGFNLNQFSYTIPDLIPPDIEFDYSGVPRMREIYYAFALDVTESSVCAVIR